MPETRLLGYELVPISMGTLGQYFKRVLSLSFPIAPDLSGMGGVDGTCFQLAVFGVYYSSWRFEWWSITPAKWKPLVDITYEMIDTFVSAEREMGN
jgi:hypothetical protein